MTYAYSMDVPQSPEMYEAVHAELQKQLGGSMPEGCLLHLATRTTDGFRVTEVWESREEVERFGVEVMQPIIARLMGLPLEEIANNPPPSDDLDLLRLEMNPPAPGGGVSIGRHRAAASDSAIA